ncbi:TetR/AcrR family transcriptional regulator [Streptomyces sp. NPDC057428]|uniref:TetR/AcrR family transcriptional regulator n=1 Tax=Streptomyces sp. NPDC057428 TaxID=3346129 RepID=UPI0036AF8769
MTHPARRPMRCDAEANRARIIAVAREALSQDPDATLKPIAKLAGVGPGTVYRHFPTREDLLVTVYRSEVEALLDTAPLIARQDPRAALRHWLERLAAHGRTGSAASQAVRAATRADPENPYYTRIRLVLTELMAACRTAKQLRSDVTAGEVLLLMSYVWNLDGSSDPEHTACRVLDIVMDGLCPGTAPTHRVMSTQDSAMT